ncbi:MAG: VTT domain-containing protein [Halioglobus sp.]|nr:VTT domain-containing protein [Halioglobus sp.]
MNSPPSGMVPGKKALWGMGFLSLSVLLALALAPYISLDYLSAQHDFFLQYYERQPVIVLLLYIAIAAVLIGAALPVTGIISLLAGALFGFVTGWAVSVIASTLGACIVFLWSRYLFRDWIESRFAEQFQTINRGISDEGGYYLFSVRLIALFPFFVVNLMSGLTAIRLSTYSSVTFLGQIISLAVWIYLGLTVAKLESGVAPLSWQTFAVLGLVGLAPLISHRAMRWFRSRTKVVN